MNDVRFEINYMQTVYADASSCQSDVRNTVYDFQVNAHKFQAEISSFNGEATKVVSEMKRDRNKIRDLIDEVESRRKAALKQKRQPIPEPKAPSFPANATVEEKNAISQAHNDEVEAVKKQNDAIQKENEAIDRYVAKCDEVIEKLVALSNEINKFIDGVQTTINNVTREIEPFLSSINVTLIEGRRCESAANEFVFAMKKAIEKAMLIFQFEARYFDGQAFVDRQFNIKNTHQHIIENASSFDFSSLNQATSETKIEKTKNQAIIETIRERNIADFYNAIEGLSKFKMPSSNLHKLGGKKFTEKMDSLGYVMVTLPSGSTIDDSGMILWEMKQ